MPTPPRLVLVLSAAAALVWIPQAWLLASALSDAALAAARGEPIPSILPEILAFLALAALRIGLDTVSVHQAQRFASRARLEIRRTIAARAARWSPVDAGRPAAGEIATLAADQVEALEPYLVRYAPTRARMAVVPLVIAAVVAWHAWAAAVVLLVAAPFIPIFMSLIGAEARDRSRVQLSEIGTFTGTLLDRVSGLPTIRLFGAVPRVADHIAEVGDEIRRRTMAVLRLAFLSSAVLELFAAVGVALVAVYVGFSLLGWIGFGTTFAPLDLASGLFILLLAPDFFQPLRDFAAAYHDKAAADAFAARHRELMDEPRSRMLDPDAGHVALLPAAPIVVCDLSVRSPDTGVLMVEDVSFAVAPGERVALWGPSGAGKSTVLAALAGLVEPSSGSVEIAGEPLSPATVGAVRRSTAWIGQLPFLERRSLRRNLALANPGAPDSRLQEALGAVGLGPLLARLPHGLSTRLGIEGAGVSGGEARRIGLARALVADRPLILADEPTADLDAETAAAVRAALLATAAGRTLVVATHDPLLARAMDRIIRLDGGRLVGEGAP
ncbi:thiol reductant ABC exporter subunit CydD [Chthonobacter albigriseus]|uniref:thiol reductant ABC exporter subunit CydD n=1 Tax=Chthonobacter albigriseus TaxID=1683161 RepID=UPI0015EF0D58|nr:thiol reductant ABC exporter subunit CydD [Chthonobacter albigriseus]